jgi:hypothetical protein
MIILNEKMNRKIIDGKGGKRVIESMKACSI